MLPALFAEVRTCKKLRGGLVWPKQMRKYRHVLGIGLQQSLTYRLNFLARALFGLIPLFAIISVWRTIYAGKDGVQVGTYTLAQMISYYLLTLVVDALTAVNEDDWQIAADIRDGNISQFLLKPMDYLWYRFALFTAGRVGYMAVAILPITLFILSLKSHFVLPANWETLGWFACSVVMTAMLQFFISYALAMLAFWVLEVSTFIFIVFAFEYIASGHLFPIDILPHGLQSVLMLTPFPYQLYFPVSIYMGKTAGADLARGLLIQLGWVVLAYAAARWAWRRGIKHYSAVGG